MIKLKLSAVFGMFVLFAALGVAAQDTATKTISGGVLNGKATSLPKPDYPAHLKEQGIGGTVSVAVVIDESGLVISAEADPVDARKRKTGDTDAGEAATVDPALREAAENAARLARFAPTFLEQVPVKIKGTITYNFVPGSSGTDDVKTVNGGVLNGKAVTLPLPQYPAAAKAVKAEGAVNVRVIVDEAGKVIEAEAVSGHPLLRSAAVDAALEARFSPTLLSGKPVRISGVVVYNFVASDKEDK